MCRLLLASQSGYVAMPAGRLLPLWYHYGVAMTLRLDARDEETLAALAAAEGVSKHEAALRAIRATGAARQLHEDRVRVLSAAARERSGGWWARALVGSKSPLCDGL